MPESPKPSRENILKDPGADPGADPDGSNDAQGSEISDQTNKESRGKVYVLICI